MDLHNLKFNKTLEQNLPANIGTGKQEVHFTETGKIFAYDNDGNPVQLGGSTETPINKFYVLCVAGQSNAVGYDESTWLPQYTTNNDPKRLKQLGFNGDNNLQIVDLTASAENFQDMSNLGNGESRDRGTRGLHLPLANLILPHLPSDYGLLILPCAYGGTSFITGADGTYDTTTLKPSTGILKWSNTSPYYLSMRDRIKHALDLNPENMFLGTIWCQGENDRENPTAHFTAFETMYNQYVADLSTYASRSVTGSIDKSCWFNMETVHYWYYTGSSVRVWENYRRFSPDTYIEIHRSAEGNNVNGNGATSGTRQTHFGNNSYTKIVAPAIYNKFLELGILNSNVEVLPLHHEPTLSFENVTVDDMYINRNADNLILSVDADNNIVYSANPNFLNGTNTFIKGDFRAIEFEVTRSFYYFIFSTNKNLSPNVSYAISLGLTNATRTKIVKLDSTIVILPDLVSDVDSINDVLLIGGDKVRVEKTEKALIIYKWDAVNARWNKIKSVTFSMYPFFSTITDLELGFSTGISNGELLAPNTLATLAKDLKISRGSKSYNDTSFNSLQW